MQFIYFAFKFFVIGVIKVIYCKYTQSIYAKNVYDKRMTCGIKYLFKFKRLTLNQLCKEARDNIIITKFSIKGCLTNN